MTANRTKLSQEFQNQIEKVTGQTFQEVTLINTGFCLMGTEEAVNAVEALPVDTFGKEYDEDFGAWFITVALSN